MNTIVMNTLGGAVTEYTGFDFQSILPATAGSTLGVFSLGGDNDAGVAIVSQITTGETQVGDLRKSQISTVFVGLRGSGSGRLSVFAGEDTHHYDFPVNEQGVSRVRPGRGIRENYLAFGFSNPAGDDFQLDAIDVPVALSPNRRTA